MRGCLIFRRDVFWNALIGSPLDYSNVLPNHPCMRLFVQPASRYPSSDVPEGALVLLSNTWNDFSYRTLYSLFVRRNGTFAQIGDVKILRHGQGKVEVPLPVGELPSGRLPADYGSLGGGLDYYERLFELDLVTEVLTRLNDLGVDARRRATFAQEEGFTVSLNRDRQDPERYYDEIVAWVQAGAPPPDPDRFSFAFRPGKTGELVQFCFGPPEGVEDASALLHPSFRVVVLVGANGVGKTRMLAQLARVAYVPPAEREAFQNEGAFEKTPAFPSIVAVSYSAFDNFDPPRLEGDNITEFAKNLRKGAGRYAYCGMRDLATALEQNQVPSRLLSLDDLERVFVQRITEIRQRGRFGHLAEVLRPVLLEASFAHMITRPVSEEGISLDGKAWSEALLDSFLGEDAGAAFRPLSSGHKIVLHQLASLTAVLQRRGLALIDEPETHLHPPLLAALMTGLRTLLQRQQSYAVIATHSPVVVQETLSSQVLIVEGGFEGASFRLADVETFGENIGTLTREIFGLGAGASDYRKILERMVTEYRTVEAIEKRLGSPLSAQALAHVMAAISRLG